MMRLQRVAIFAAAALLLSAQGACGTLLRQKKDVSVEAPKQEPVLHALDGWAHSTVARLRSSVVTRAPRQMLSLLSLAHSTEQTDPAGAYQETNTDSEEAREDAQQLGVRLLIGLVSVAIWMGLEVLVAKYYLNHKVHPGENMDPNTVQTLSSFKYGPFDCLNRPDISLWACFCPAIRWADNVSTMGVLRSFWVAWLLWIGFQMLAAESQDLIAWILVSLVGALFRHELRLKFQMAVGGAIFFQDCLLYCFCPCCAITQEARQVEAAVKTGHPEIAEKKMMAV